MEQLIYERPREKLRNRGVASLSVAELLQVIIGSGSAQASGARLARQVERVMREKQVSYESFTSIPGIGGARACQILAALELGGRYDG